MPVCLQKKFRPLKINLRIDATDGVAGDAAVSENQEHTG